MRKIILAFCTLTVAASLFVPVDVFALRHAKKYKHHTCRIEKKHYRIMKRSATKLKHSVIAHLGWQPLKGSRTEFIELTETS